MRGFFKVGTGNILTQSSGRSTIRLKDAIE